MTAVLNVALRVGEHHLKFTLAERGALALVGGAAANQAGAALLLLDRQTVEVDQLLLAGRSLLGLSERELRKIRGAEMTLLSAADEQGMHPLYTVGHQLSDVIRAHRRVSKQAACDHAIDMLELAGLEQPQRVVTRYPHQLSAPQRARVALAVALANSPRLLVGLDPFGRLEPTAQLQLLDLLSRLRSHLGFALVFTTRNPAAAALLSESAIEIGELPVLDNAPLLVGAARIKYLGEVVETGQAELLMTRPRHPYTGALVSAYVLLNGAVRQRDVRRRILLLGDAPAQPPPTGCPLRTRCPKAQPLCGEERPELKEHPGGSALACHFPLTDHELSSRLPTVQLDKQA
jgi:oligopeptide/dipeptide ABC transporter ATP-binding protein